MKILRQIGNATNTPTNEYMVETDEERDALKDTAPFGSYCIQFGKIQKQKRTKFVFIY